MNAYMNEYMNEECIDAWMRECMNESVNPIKYWLSYSIKSLILVSIVPPVRVRKQSEETKTSQLPRITMPYLERPFTRSCASLESVDFIEGMEATGQWMSWDTRIPWMRGSQAWIPWKDFMSGFHGSRSKVVRYGRYREISTRNVVVYLKLI